MTTTFPRIAMGIAGFVLLDGIWLGLVLKNFCRDQLAPIARPVNGGIAPNWPAALVVYVLLGTGIALLVTPRASGLGSAATHGALFGLVAYGVYDFTNYSTLRQWPLLFMLADLAWGAAASAGCATAVWAASR